MFVLRMRSLIGGCWRSCVSLSIMATPYPFEDRYDSKQSLVLECPICREPYAEDFDHVPRTLQCGHTFCTSCLKNLMAPRTLTVCPICNVIHPGPRHNVTQFPINNAVLTIVRSIPEETAKKGYIRIRSRSILITGAGGAGKTATMSVMIGEKPPDTYTSTDAITTPMRVASITNSSELLVRDVDTHRVCLTEGDFTWLKGNKLLQLLARGAKILSQADGKPSAVEQPRYSSEAPSHPDSGAISDYECSPEKLALEVLSRVTGLMKDRSSSEPLAVIDLLHIIDSGGQLRFHEMVNKFVENLQAILFVRDINKKPSDYVLDQFYSDGKPVGEPYKSQYTHEQLFKRSLQALQLQNQSAKLAVVATHIDQVDEDKRDEKIMEENEWVSNIMKGAQIDAKKIIYRGRKLSDIVFALQANSLSASREQAQKLLKHLRDDIPVEIKDIPLPYFLLEQTMREFGEENRGIVSMSECHRIARNFNMSPEVLHIALRYLCDQNLILYYPEVIDDIVFCEVQTLLSIITQLVQYSAQVRADSELINVPEAELDPGRLSDLANCGTLNEQLLLEGKEFSKQFDKNLTAEKFLKLMQHLEIIAEKSTHPSIEYFMPCILREIPKDDLQQRRMADNINAEPLLLYFGEWPQAGIFCTLIARLVSKYGWDPKPFLANGSTVECLYRNCVSFEVQTDSEHCCDVTLIESYDCGYFEVHIDLPAGEECYQTVCPIVRDMLLKALPSEVQPKDAFLCCIKSCRCKTEPHAAVLQNYLKCTKGLNPKEKLGSTDKRYIWFGCTGSDSASGQHDHSKQTSVCVVSSGDLPEVLDLLKELACVWDLFLGQLIPVWKVKEIQLTRAGVPDGPTRCLSDGLYYWADSSDSPTYEKIIAVLRGRVVPNIPLADRVEAFARKT